MCVSLSCVANRYSSSTGGSMGGDRDSVTAKGISVVTFTIRLLSVLSGTLVSSNNRTPVGLSHPLSGQHTASIPGWWLEALSILHVWGYLVDIKEAEV